MSKNDMGGMGVVASSYALNPVPPIAYRPADACRIIGVGKSTLYNLIRSGKLKPKKLGKATLFLHSDLEKLLEG